MQQVGVERGFVEVNRFEGVAHTAVQHEVDFGGIVRRVDLDVVFAEFGVEVAARAGKRSEARFVGFVGFVVENAALFQGVVGEYFLEGFVLRRFAGDLYVDFAQLGDLVLVHGVGDAQAVAFVLNVRIHFTVVVAEGLLGAADFFAAVFDEVLDVVGLFDFFADGFFQGQVGFGVVVLLDVVDAAYVDIEDGFAHEVGSIELRRGSSVCCFGFDGGCGRFGVQGQGEQGSEEGGKQFVLHGVVPWVGSAQFELSPAQAQGEQGSGVAGKANGDEQDEVAQA